MITILLLCCLIWFVIISIFLLLLKGSRMDCPRCGSDKVVVVDYGKSKLLVCENCGGHGELY